MAALFEHTFQEVLLGVGAVLCLGGVLSAVFSAPQSFEGGFAESISYGFTAFFMALFAGALIGVGTAMAADALILGLRGNKLHVAAAAAFSLLSLLISASAASDARLASFPLFVLFFAGLSAAGAFMASAAVFGFSALFTSFVNRAYAPAHSPVAEGGKSGRQAGARQRKGKR